MSLRYAVEWGFATIAMFCVFWNFEGLACKAP